MKENRDLSRRKFLKGSLVGAGALTAGVGAGLFMPSKAHAGTPPTLPLPYCRDSAGNPTATPHASNTTVLDVDDVRVMAWWMYNNGRG